MKTLRQLLEEIYKSTDLKAITNAQAKLLGIKVVKGWATLHADMEIDSVTEAKFLSLCTNNRKRKLGIPVIGDKESPPQKETGKRRVERRKLPKKHPPKKYLSR